jgi:hypothetical protein
MRHGRTGWFEISPLHGFAEEDPDNTLEELLGVIPEPQNIIIELPCLGLHVS